MANFIASTGLSSLMQDFLHWWWAQISEVFQLTFASLTRDVTIVDLSFEKISIVKRDGSTVKSEILESNNRSGQEKVREFLSAEPDNAGAIVLRLPESELLRCFLTIPTVASGRLEELLGYEIDRATPFSRDEVFWTYAVRQRDNLKKTILIELVVIPFSSYAFFEDTLSHIGIEPKGIEVSASDGPAMVIPLEVPTHQRLVSPKKWPIVAAFAAAILLVLVATPFIIQSRAMSAANATISLYDSEAKQAGSFRHSIRVLTRTSHFLDEQRTRTADPIIVMASVSKLLPLESYLTAFSLRANHVTISGLSPSAAQLITLFAQSNAFREPAFISPITQDESSRLESFAMTVQVPGAGR